MHNRCLQILLLSRIMVLVHKAEDYSMMFDHIKDWLEIIIHNHNSSKNAVSQFMHAPRTGHLHIGF